jgi:cytochrome P450
VEPIEDLSRIDLADPTLYAHDRHVALFKRLRKQAPVHLQRDHPVIGNFWNLTRHEDIAQVDADHRRFPCRNSFLMQDFDSAFPLTSFLASEPPAHTHYREALRPLFSREGLMALQPLIRQRAVEILEGLPVGQEFDWVEHVAIELTSHVLALLFDFPLEQRMKLIEWSELATHATDANASREEVRQRQLALMDCLSTMQALERERAGRPRRAAAPGIVELLSTSRVLGRIKPSELLGNIILMLVAGNDTTRNSITGGVLALNRHPEQYRRLREQPGLLPAAVREMFRWQTPIGYIRRVAATDTEIGGEQIRAGDKVVMWFASANLDDSVFENAHAYVIDRPNAQRSLAFGLGIHRCLGAALADLQMRVLWEEILARFIVEQAGEPAWTSSVFVKGYSRLPVVLHAKA